MKMGNKNLFYLLGVFRGVFMMSIQGFIKKQVFELKLWEINEYFSKFSVYVEDLKKQLQVKIGNSKNSLQNESNENLQEQIDSDLTSYYEEYDLTESVVERNFYYSVIIQLYTHVELAFNDLCKYNESISNKKIKLSDFSGKGVERAKNYLVKVYDFVFDALDSELLNELNLIRNIIAHYNGNLKVISNNDQLNKITTLLNKNNEVSRSKDDYIILSQNYINSCLSKIREIFKKIYSNI